MESSRKQTLILRVTSISVFLLLVTIYSVNKLWPVNHHAGYRFPYPEEISSGDIVLRMGNGLVSEIAKSFSQREQRFSHVGILVQTKTAMVVVHSVLEDEKNFNGVVVEKLDSFLKDASDWAVYRIKLPADKRHAIATEALKKATEKIPFDSEYDLQTKDRLYCTEFVWQTINRVAGKQLIHADTLKLGRRFVSIDDIYLNPSMSLITDYSK